MSKKIIYAEDAIDALNILFKKQITQFDYKGYEEADEKTQLVCDGISESIGCVMNLPSAQPQALIDQLRWERDIAIKQLHDLGYEFGEEVKDAQPEDIARDIATIIENEKDMRVMLHQRWIPVSEVMPDEHDRVLILTDEGTIFIGDHNEYWEDDYEFEIDDVTAWMPLPKPWEGEKK